MIVVPIVIALISIFVCARFFTNEATYQGIIDSIDDSKNKVLALMGSSTAASAAISILPGDICTPIAQELAQISSYFVIVLCALYLEKFLLTVIGFLSCYIIIPVACFIFVADVFLDKDYLKAAWKKLLVFGIAIILIIPISVFISDRINDAYGKDIATIIDDAKEKTEAIQGDLDEAEKETAEESSDEASVKESDSASSEDSKVSDSSDEASETSDSSASDDKDDSSSSEESEDKGFWGNLVDNAKEKYNNTVDNVKNSVSYTVDSIADYTSIKTKEMEEVLNNMIEALAVLIVTSCLIPILVMLVFVWLVKIIFNLDIKMEMPKNGLKKIRKKDQKAIESDDE